MTVSHQKQEKGLNDNQGKLNKRLALYSLAAGSAIVGAGTQSADAVIVYSGELNYSISPYTSTFFNFDNDDYNDMLLKNYVFSTPYTGVFMPQAPGKVVGANPGFPNYAYALAYGDPINSTTIAGGPFQATLGYAGNASSEFDDVTDAYLGFVFANYHYGWVRVDIDVNAGTFVVKDWAYETESGVGITAGAVPEPGALGLLAAGAAGLAGLRRRRKA